MCVLGVYSLNKIESRYRSQFDHAGTCARPRDSKEWVDATTTSIQATGILESDESIGSDHRKPLGRSGKRSALGQQDGESTSSQEGRDDYSESVASSSEVYIGLPKTGSNRGVPEQRQETHRWFRSRDDVS